MDLLFSVPENRRQNWEAHNEESRALWDAFGRNTHERVPIRLNTNPRVLMLNPAYNTRGISYEDYMMDPDLMARVVLEWQHWVRMCLPGDQEWGLPEQWVAQIDFENTYDAAWFGCPVHYRAGEVPDTEPILREGNKRMLFDQGPPDPFAGEWAERALSYLEHFQKKAREGWEFMGRPVVAAPHAPFIQTDGVFTVAANLRGATELCMDLLADPDYVHELLAYVSEAQLTRIKAWRKHLELPEKQEDFWTADDSVLLISTEQYRDFVLNHHRALYDALAGPSLRGMHMCGNAQRHFKTIHEELGVTAFDTGFPVDYQAFRQELGTDVLLCGGPRVSYFLAGDADALLAETARILNSGILEGGRMILQEANNLPPCVDLDLLDAFYAQGKELGRVPGR